MVSRVKQLCIAFLLFSSVGLGYPGFNEPWGKDADVHYPMVSEVQMARAKSPMAWAAEKLIWFHQNILSPVDGPRSHFRPSSSGYMLEAIQKHGFIKGYLMGCDRLLRENSEKWVYPTIEYDGRTLKWDPPPNHLY
jgi:putative component of membrane protein insertase Oxa1/YidC/SpoIIIJ protein YidD